MQQQHQQSLLKGNGEDEEEEKTIDFTYHADNNYANGFSVGRDYTTNHHDIVTIISSDEEEEDRPKIIQVNQMAQNNTFTTKRTLTSILQTLKSIWIKQN